MVNGFITAKFVEQENFIKNIFNKYFHKTVNSIQNLIKLNNYNKPNKDAFKIKTIHNIQNISKFTQYVY